MRGTSASTSRAATGAVTGGAPEYERFVVGGSPSPYVEDLLLSQRLVNPALPFGAAAGSRMGRLRLQTTYFVTPFVEWIGAGDALGTYQRVQGLEVRGRLGPFPSLRVPELSVQAGVAGAPGAAWTTRTHGYFSVTLRP